MRFLNMVAGEWGNGRKEKATMGVILTSFFSFPTAWNRMSRHVKKESLDQGQAALDPVPVWSVAIPRESV